jgi:hypothetical protein
MGINFKKVALILAFPLGGYIFFLLVIQPFVGKLFSNEPPKPHLQVPVTYNIGWWTNQDSIVIDDLSVKLLDSNLNLFHSNTLVSYQIKGKMKVGAGWKPHISQVFVSERLNKDTTQHFDRIIELEPVMNCTHLENQTAAIFDFDITNEHVIKSNHWGNNKIKFICGKHESIVSFHQKK